MKILRHVGIAAVAATALTIGAASPAFAHDIEDNSRGTTTVVLNQALVPGLVGLGVAPVAPGTLTAPNGVYQVAFPITKVKKGRIAHAGGLEFTKAAAGDVEITRFVVDTNTGFLTAKTEVNGKNVGRIPVFKLGPTQAVSEGVVPACAGVAAGLSLTSQAAAALGVPSGTFVGDACVVPTSREHADDSHHEDHATSRSAHD